LGFAPEATRGHYVSGFGAWTAQDVAGAMVGGVHDITDVFDAFDQFRMTQW
jgi:hypothetical protein